jgi:formylmethanofuran--tetrahydromethanopterin N-formyltransferase
MIRNGVLIDDTYAEAFGMKATRILITADSLAWAKHAARAAFGFATSVIACGCEAGIERELAPDETPDGRPGVAGLLFAVSTKELAKQLERRVGQCVLTCPTTAVFAGCEGEESLPLGKNLRYFGDGWQMSKVIAGQRYWRIPVMDGEFLAQESTGLLRSVGGGNFLVLARSRAQALAACEAAVEAIDKVPGAITPFPGGVVRSGSKVGSKYKALPASTNDAYCPTLRGRGRSQLPEDVEAVLEIVIDGLDRKSVV